MFITTKVDVHTEIFVGSTEIFVGNDPNSIRFVVVSFLSIGTHNLLLLKIDLISYLIQVLQWNTMIIKVKERYAKKTLSNRGDTPQTHIIEVRPDTEAYSINVSYN